MVVNKAIITPVTACTTSVQYGPLRTYHPFSLKKQLSQWWRLSQNKSEIMIEQLFDDIMSVNCLTLHIFSDAGGKLTLENNDDVMASKVAQYYDYQQYGFHSSNSSTLSSFCGILSQYINFTKTSISIILKSKIPNPVSVITIIVTLVCIWQLCKDI